MRTIKDNIKEAIGRSLDAYNKKFGKAIHDRIDNIVAQAGTDNTEIVDARVDSSGKIHTTLNNRINEEFKKGKEHMQSVSGSHLNLDGTMESYLQNIEIEGNTIQNPNNLSDIKSVGDKVEDEELYRIPIVCCGANINSTNLIRGNCNTNTGVSESGGMTILITSDFLKVPENTTFSYDTNGIKIRNIITFSYDADKKYIGYENTIKSKPGAKFIKVRFTKDDRTEFTDKEVNDIRLSINVGEQSIPYEDYKEHKITILSPTPIGKIGNVTDRIIEKDGVWGIEKRTHDWTLDSNTTVRRGGKTPGNLYVFNIIKDCNDSTVAICNYLPFIKNWTSSTPCFYTQTTDIVFMIDEDITLDEFKSRYVGKLTFKLIAENSQFIPLPHAQQVKLKTFANKTNISFLTEIEGTIKADVAKSISASVNSNTQEISKINNRILDLEGLKESQEMSYSTDKGYLVCKETRVGTVKDMKIYGKSLANIFKISRSDKNDTKLFYECDRNIGTTFKGINVTLLNPTSKKVIFDIRSSNTGNWLRSVIMNANELSKYVTLTDDEYIGYIYGQVVDGWVSSNEELQKLKGCCVVVTGDHTQSPPSGYFEGIASVGTGVDKIEVSSVKSDGNLFSGKLTNVNSRGFYLEDINFSIIPKLGTFSFKTETKYNRNSLYLKANSPSYTRAIGLVSYKNGIALANYNLTDADLDIINQNSRGLRIEVYRNDGDCDTPTEICINKGDNPILYQPHKQDKKHLLFKDTDGTWKPIPVLPGYWEDGEFKWGDVVDSVKGKWYKRTLVHTFDSKFLSENIRIIADYGDVTRVDFTVDGIKTGGMFICDKYKAISIGTPDTVGVNVHGTQKNTVQLQIKTTDLTTKDIQGVISFLTKNPFEMVIELAEEKVFEVNPLFLESYEGETMVSTNSGVINAPIEFKITSYITNLVLLNQQRISILEQEMFSMFKAVLSGDMRALAESIYPEDFIYENEPPIMLLSK